VVRTGLPQRDGGAGSSLKPARQLGHQVVRKIFTDRNQSVRVTLVIAARHNQARRSLKLVPMDALFPQALTKPSIEVSVPLNAGEFAFAELLQALPWLFIKPWSDEMLSTILIILIVLLLLGALPALQTSASWGYVPGGLLGTILAVVVILALLGHI
jgi:hypothetical protein